MDELSLLLKRYNNTYHRTIKTTLVEASKHNSETDVQANTYVPTVAKSKAKLIVGDKVRASKIKKTFEKGYTNNWSREVFKISEVLRTNPMTYKFVEYDDSKIEGSFMNENYRNVYINYITV